MAEKTFTSMSKNEDVMQQLFWDDELDSLNVQHEINLVPEISARPGAKYQYPPRSQKDPEFKIYAEKCADYGLDPGKKYTITEYEYDEYEDSVRNYRMLEVYPGIEQFFLLSGLPHFVVVSLNKIGGNVSRTSGEALPAR